MKNLFLILFVALVATAPARAALVYDANYYPTTGPGGLSTPYPSGTPDIYAGLLEMVYNGSPLLVMSDDHANRANVGESWAMHLYSYAEVQAGAPVRFTKEQYARAAHFLYFNGLFNSSNLSLSGLSLRQLAEANGNDQLADLNMGVWDIMASSSLPSKFVGGDTDIFDWDTFNWSGEMAVASGGPGRDEYLIPLASQGLTLASGTVTIAPSVPLPPAAWLLGSGLIGLVGVAKKKTTRS